MYYKCMPYFWELPVASYVYLHLTLNMKVMTQHHSSLSFDFYYTNKVLENEPSSALTKLLM